MGGGQMVAADFILTPAVVFSESNAGGVGGAVWRAVRARRSVGAIAGGLKFKEAQTSMLRGRRAQRRAGGRGRRQHQEGRHAARRGPFGGGGGAAAGGYGNTNEGKIIAAAFMDNYNKIVRRRPQRSEPAAQRRHAEAGSGGGRHDARPARVFNEGDVLVAEDRRREAAGDARGDAGKVVATLARADEVVVIGEEKNGFINVQGATARGLGEDRLDDEALRRGSRLRASAARFTKKRLSRARRGQRVAPATFPLTAAITAFSSPYGSFTTVQSLLMTIVARVAVS